MFNSHMLLLTLMILFFIHFLESQAENKLWFKAYGNTIGQFEQAHFVFNIII